MRLASVAPEGSAWANLLRDWARELEAITARRGARPLVLLRHHRRRARRRSTASTRATSTASASGGIVCERLAPSMKVQGLAGVFQSREEAAYVMERLRPTLEEETAHAGFALLITTGLGPEVLFTRTPVRSMAELRKMKLWRWARRRAGHRHVARDGADGRADRRSTSPARPTTTSASTASSPSRRRRWPSSGRRRRATSPICGPGYLTGCVLVAHRALDRLTAEQQKTFRSLFAKYDALFQEMGRRQDEALLGGLFEKQGLKPIPPSEGFRSEFFETARAARERAATRFVSRAALDRVLKLLADYRAEHAEVVTPLRSIDEVI